MQPGLREALQGHLVAGHTICPASVVMDMALTAAEITLEKCGVPVKDRSLELTDLRIPQALVASCDEGSKIARISATLTEDARSIAIAVRSSQESAAATRCTCTVTAPESLAPSHQRATMRRLVGSRVKALDQSRSAHRMATPLFYRLFNDVVRYSKPY